MLKRETDVGPSGLNPRQMAFLFGAAAFLLRFPFLFRYDNHFGGDSAVNYVAALDFLKGRPSLFLNGADYVSTFEPFLASCLFRVFGPSIPLYGAVMLLEWSLAVGVGVYLFARGTSRTAGMFAGAAAAVGVPYTMTYTTVPSDSAFILLSMVLLLETYRVVEKGGSPRAFLALGFTAGAALFISKKCVPAEAVCAAVLLFVRTPQWPPGRLLRLRTLAPLAGAALAGFSPEIWYRLNHPAPQDVFGIVSASGLVGNIRTVLRCTLAYFDAQPSSRMQDAFYYWLHVGAIPNNPSGIGDAVCLLIGSCTLALLGAGLLRAFSRKNTALLLLGGLAAFNLLLMAASSRLNPADPNLPRRYLMPAAVSLSLWTGYLFAWCSRAKWKYGRPAALVLMFLFLGRSLYHDYVLWKAPDDLREVRWLAADMEKNGVTMALGDWGLDYMVMGLTNGRITVAEPYGHELGSPRAREEVARAGRIAVLGGGEPPAGREERFEFAANRFRVYRRDGAVHRSRNLWWAPYRAAGPWTGDRGVRGGGGEAVSGVSGRASGRWKKFPPRFSRS